MKKLVYPDDLDILVEIVVEHIDPKSLVDIALEEGISVQESKEKALKETRSLFYKEWRENGKDGVETLYTSMLYDELANTRENKKVCRK